jgi:cytoskeletal protein CcmA (bactofilin family)
MRQHIRKHVCARRQRTRRSPASACGDTQASGRFYNSLFLYDFVIGTQYAWHQRRSTTHQGILMLQKEGLFRRREETFPARTPAAPAPQASAPERVAAPPPPPAPHAEAGKAVGKGEAKLIVGPDIKMKGVEITDCDTLAVEGRIEATLDARVLQIAPQGIFSGTVAVDNAEIHGRLEGELTVRKQLVIHATGKVSGKIRYAKIKVEEGAEIAGEISMLDSNANANAAPLRAARPLGGA